MAAGYTQQHDGAIERRIVKDVVRQHAELAAFFWAQRDTLAAEDPPDESVVAGIDRRLEANLDGLRIAGTAAWSFIEAAYEDFPEKGELFLFAWFAIEQGNDGKVRQAIELGRASDDDAQGLVGALAWHKAETISPLVRHWITARDAFLRYLAVAACRGHGVEPEARWARLARERDLRGRANSLRLAGILKRVDLMHDVAGSLDSKDERVRLWAAWALNEFGRGDMALAELKKVVAANGPNAPTALRAVIKAGSRDDVRAFIGGLLKSPATAPLPVRRANQHDGDDAGEARCLREPGIHSRSPALLWLDTAKVHDIRRVRPSDGDVEAAVPIEIGDRESVDRALAVAKLQRREMPAGTVVDIDR